MAVYFGVAVGFYQGDNLKLMDDMAALRPTIFSSVPRLYNRIYDGIMNAVKQSGGLKERLFNAAYNAKKQAMLNGKNPSPMWDRLVFNKIREKLGGRVRFITSGASPLSPDVMEFLKICFGGRVTEGYGMTETSCVISSMDEGDNLTGHVGSPSPACEIKLVDVPEMNYTSEDQPYPRGEICVRGPIVFRGYHKDEVQTREVIDEDGWLHTGDIGLWLPGGRLKIIDRKKNIFKLAQGEYIAPEKIENVYAKCKFVSQCFVYGDSFNSSLVAIVSIDQDALKAWAVSEGIKNDDLAQLCNDPKVKAAVLADMDAVGREAQLRGFEFVKAVTLVLEPFTMENGLLTPTFKIKISSSPSSSDLVPDTTQSKRRSSYVGDKTQQVRRRKMTLPCAMATSNNGRVLVVGATGFMGRFVAEASIESGRPTYVLVRPGLGFSPSKASIIKSLQERGAIVVPVHTPQLLSTVPSNTSNFTISESIFSVRDSRTNANPGQINDRELMEKILKEHKIEIVISAVGGEAILDQIALVEAIRAVGTIKRFLPSEFGHDVDRADPVEPGLRMYKEKRIIRRMIEEYNLPYTYICCNSIASWPYYDNTHPSEVLPPLDQFQIYGDGSVKAYFVAGSDIGKFTMKVADDVRTLNMSVHFRPACNFYNMNELASLWETKIGRTLPRVTISEADLLSAAAENVIPRSVVASFTHDIFIKGCQANFSIDGPNEVEVTALYPEEPFRTLDECFDDFALRIEKPVDAEGIKTPNAMVEQITITAKCG